MNVILIVETFIAFVIAVTIHEAVQAAVASLLGDMKPAQEGRLSLVPSRQMAAIGTIVAIVSSVGSLAVPPGGLGWGKPVDPDARRMRTGPNAGLLLVAVSGIAANAVLGVALAIAVHALPGFAAASALSDRCVAFGGGAATQTCLESAQSVGLLRFEQFLLALAVTNVLLAILNLIPLHPLDGYKILYALLPTRQALSVRSFEPYMEFTLLVIFFVIPYILAFLRIPFNPKGGLIYLANALVSGIVGPFINVYLML
jgi:Zn-dependent protease